MSDVSVTLAKLMTAALVLSSIAGCGSEWFERQTVEGGRRGGGLSDAGKADLRWRLSSHLLPAFVSRRLDQITVEDVDRYRLAKVREGKLKRHLDQQEPRHARRDP